MSIPSLDLGASLASFYTKVDILEQLAGVMEGQARLKSLRERLAAHPEVLVFREEIERESTALTAELQKLLEHLGRPAHEVIELLDDNEEETKDALRVLVASHTTTVEQPSSQPGTSDTGTNHSILPTEQGPPASDGSASHTRLAGGGTGETSLNNGQLVETEMPENGVSATSASSISQTDGPMNSSSPTAAEEMTSLHTSKTRSSYLTDQHIQYLTNWKIEHNDTKIRWAAICKKVPLFRGKSPTRCQKAYYAHNYNKRKRM